MIPLRDDNPTSITPAITVGLIAINVLVFLYQLSLGPQGERLLVYQYGSIPSVIFGAQKLPTDVQVIPPTLSLFTSMFLHGGFMHLIGNMLYLWIFGNNIEDAMGHVRVRCFLSGHGAGRLPGSCLYQSGLLSYRRSAPAAPSQEYWELISCSIREPRC